METNKKRHQVHRLPTEDMNPAIVPCLLSANGNIHKHLTEAEFRRLIKFGGCTPQHLYFTTDDKDIQEGEVYFGDTGRLIIRGNTLLPKGRKIIASTDPKLTNCSVCGVNLAITEGKHKMSCKDAYKRANLPQISQDFIKAYCEQGGINEVNVEYDRVSAFEQRGLPSRLKTNILKLNPDNTIIIHPVEEKMYSRGEVLSKLEEFEILHRDGWDLEDLNKWIKENL